MRYITRGSVVIALCSMTTSCSSPDSAGQEGTTDLVAAGLAPDLDLLRANTRDHLTMLGAPVEELEANLNRVTEAALQGDYDVDAFAAILDSLAASSEEAEKASLVLYLYADSVMAGYRLDDVEQNPGVALGSLALCNTCTTPAALAPPSAACSFVSGNTTSACVSDFYTVVLPANNSCTFTMCTGTCGGSSFGYDTRIRIRTPGTCAINQDNDDSCGLGSLATHVTGAAAETKIIEVTGFTTGNFGTYNMGYRCTPVAANCPFTGTLGTPQGTTQPGSSGPKRTWAVNNRIFRSGVISACVPGKACPGGFATGFLVPHDAWDFPAAPASRCITVTTFNNTCPQVHSQSYRGSFPTGASTTSCAPVAGVSYLGDSGSSDLAGGLPVTSSFTVPAGTAWSHVVTQPISAVAGGCSYSFRVSPCSPIPPSACAPQIQSVTPGSGSAGEGCARTENFTVNFQHNTWTAPATVTLTLTPPAGGSASPTTFTRILTSPVSSTTFGPVAMTRANCPASGNFTVRATATNSCVPPIPLSTLDTSYSLLDTTPPVYGPLNNICLWPPNHESLCQNPLDMRTVTDNCGSVGIVAGAESCQSNEADDALGDGNTSGDCTIGIDDVGGAQSVCTRAERSGTNPDGRLYTVMGRARDACGNFTPSTLLQAIDVPHDQSEHPECIAP